MAGEGPRGDSGEERARQGAAAAPLHGDRAKAVERAGRAGASGGEGRNGAEPSLPPRAQPTGGGDERARDLPPGTPNGTTLPYGPGRMHKHAESTSTSNGVSDAMPWIKVRRH